MLTTRPQVHIFTREVELATGEHVIAYFAVIEMNGSYNVRLIGTKPAESEAKAATLLLDAPKETIWYETPIRTVFEAVSPFFTLDFLTSQLARAPSRA